MSQLSAKASVFKPINYIGEISKEVSTSQGVGDLFTATSYNTVFGYIASGSIPVSSENKPHCGLIKDNVDLEKTMRRFWEIENVEPETIKNKETIICEEHFQKNHTRDSTGRYIVSMPFKKDPNCLGQSKDIALKN
ncbi:integrase catalytic domain-containing protein [Trichonephila clavipes]|nr:integrase catalytic domain-containing protein [Trichonephila clavipes]